MNDEVYAYVRTSRIGDSSFELEYALIRMVNGCEELCTTGSTVCIAYDYENCITASIPDYQRMKMQQFEALV